MSQTIEDRLKEANADMEKAKSFIPFGKMIDGENTFSVDRSVPLEKSKFGRTTYTGDLNSERVKLSLPKSVEMQVLLGIKKGKTSFKITKSGEGMKTKYVVK